MRLLLYNIRYGAGTGRRFHSPLPYSGYLKPVNGNFARIVRYIRSAKPDIIGLIEADFGSYRVDYSNQAEQIARALNHTAIYRNKYDTDSLVSRVPLLNKQGNALLTSQEIEATRFHYFQNGVKRLIIEMELAEVTIFLVHLSLKYRHRQYQLNDLHDLITGCTKPVVVAGDFNAMRGHRELQLFLAASRLVSANNQGAATWPSRAPLLQLDYIFHSPQIKTKRLRIHPVNLSDHRPFLWDFEVPPAQTESPAII